MTITSNIHIGLPAWVGSTAYSVVGKRVSNASNAYQVITAGTSASSGGPTGTGSSIVDGSVVWKYLSSIDYNSLQAWGNAIPQTLTQNIVGQVWNDGAITTTNGVPFLTLGVSGNQRTVGTFTITLTAAPGESFRDKLKGTNIALNASQSNGVYFQMLSSGTGNINYFDIYDSSVIFDSLQFVDPWSASNSTIININTSTTFTLSNCIIDGYPQSGGAVMVVSQNTLGMTNCLVIDRTATGADGIAVESGSSSTTSYLVNNTFVRLNPTNGSEFAVAYLVNTAVALAGNNIFIGYTTPVGGNGSPVIVDHCAMSSPTVGLATDNGTNIFNISSSTQFVSSTTDFRLQGGSDAINRALTDTTHVPSAVDILRYARPQGTAWSLGAIEYTAQILAAIGVGRVASSGNIGTANNAVGIVGVKPIAAVVTARQTDMTSATVSIGTITAIVTGNVANLLSAVDTIGPIVPIVSATQFDLASATITLSPVLLGSLSPSIIATASAGLGPVTAVAAGNIFNPMSGIVSIGLPSSSSSFGQVDFASATVTFAVTGSATISPTIVFITGLGSIFAVTSSISAVQVDNASATVSIIPNVVVTGFQSDLLANTPTLAIGPITVSAQSRQDDNLSLLRTIVPSAVVAAGQSDRINASASLLPAIIANINQSYIATLAVSIGTMVPVVSGNQEDLLITAISIGQVASTVTLTNPIPAVGLMTLVISCVAAGQTQNQVTAHVTIGPLTCVAGQAAIVTATVTAGAITAAAVFANPYPATALVSIQPITTLATIANLLPILASATIGLLPSTSGSFGQSDQAHALISLTMFTIGGVNNAPRLRVSQTVEEVLTTGGNLRVSQAATEVLSSGGILRISQAAIEVLVQSTLPSAGRVSQLVGEVLARGTPHGVVTQSVQEVLTGGIGNQNVRMTQVLTEVLTGGSGTQDVLMTQIVLETLISAIPLKTNGTTFIMV